MKTYLIPHNYKNNGRILNIFYPKNIAAALVWLVPTTLITVVLPGSINVKLFVYILVAIPPSLLILVGYGTWAISVIKFTLARRVYYDTKKGDGSAYAYWRTKAAAAKTTKAGIDT